MKLGAYVDTIVDRVYRGPLRRLVRLTGVEPIASGMYHGLQAVLGNTVVTYEAGGTRASFSRSPYLPTRLPERPVVESVLAETEPADTFFDLGANRGIYTCLVGSTLTDGQVHAFEPNPAVFEELVENVERNAIAGRTTLHRAAVSSSHGEREFFISQRSTGNSLSPGSAGVAESVTVRACSIDDLIDAGEIPPPNVIKMDVEGAEYDALRGMESTLRDGPCRVIYCEIHESILPDFGATADAVEDLIRDCGFSVERISQRAADHYTVKATAEVRRD